MMDIESDDDILWYEPGMEIKKGMKISFKGEEISVVDEDYIHYIIDMMENGDRFSSDYPWGLFLIPHSDGSFTAVDNKHEAFTEEFESIGEALFWLNDEFEFEPMEGYE